MKKELDEALCRDFPNVFKQRHQDMKRTAMCWGFECGDGWEPIIREAADKIEKEILTLSDEERENGTGQASQVKEKYGTLRFYLSRATDVMWKAVEEAEEKSETTCETCGKPGSIRGRSWIYTACEEHHNDK